MIGSFISKIFGNKSAKDIKRLAPITIEINQLYKTLSPLSDEELIEKYQSLKRKLKEQIDLNKKELINKSENIDEIAQKSASLSQVMMKLGEAAYKDLPDDNDQETSEDSSKKDDADVVDADFEEVDNEKQDK